MKKISEHSENSDKQKASDPENQKSDLSEKTDTSGKLSHSEFSDKYKQSLIDKEISTKTFILSHFFLLLISLLAIVGLYYYLYGDASDDWKNMAPLTQAPKSLTLEVNNPDDDSLVFDKNLVISGKTMPGAVLIVTINGADLGFESNKKGDFSKIVTLTSGANTFTITALDSRGGSKTVEKVVYYSEEKI
ncbi:hypothetical protein A3E66_01300 [Candidatus Daviesbacteria bacterium RIFCSPHIGHO2_12_FULL_37_16]|nr:MAG: hypothetical protein A3E66_01300 [Candidatus Daviesbacteria bacterium RIFCSPHIGHO2_12_FULL_37_16]